MDAKEFKEIRLKHKLSARKIADLLGIKAVRTIRYYEAGEYPIPETIVKLMGYIFKDKNV